MEGPKAIAGSDRRRALAAVCAALLLVFGCTTVIAKTRKSLREPGVHFRDLPETVAAEYGCADRELPHVEVETNELLPPLLRPGGEFNHRLVYALCPQGPTEVVSGWLETRIRHKGDAFVIERVDRYELKPGRWIIDAFIALPEDAEPGVYALEVEFEGSELRFLESVSFAVEGS